MSQKVKIAARLRPRIKGELDDEGVRVVHAEDDGPSSICVTNPRDISQVFKFPYVSAALPEYCGPLWPHWLIGLMTSARLAPGSLLVTTKLQHRRIYSKQM